jgi:hypothetical protein
MSKIFSEADAKEHILSTISLGKGGDNVTVPEKIPEMHLDMWLYSAFLTCYLC